MNSTSIHDSIQSTTVTTGSPGVFQKAQSAVTVTVTSTTKDNTELSSIETTQWWFYWAAALCFVLLALTLANIYVLYKKANQSEKAPEGHENLLEVQT